jgi:hypothetical protein
MEKLEISQNFMFKLLKEHAAFMAHFSHVISQHIFIVNNEKYYVVIKNGTLTGKINKGFISHCDIITLMKARK